METVRASSTRARPPLIVTTGASGAGRSDWAIQRHLGTDSRSLLLVVSPEQADTRRRQVIALSHADAADVNLSVLHFRELITHILHSPSVARTLETSHAPRPLRRLILDEIFANTPALHGCFDRMREAPGFVPELLAQIQEWKLQGIMPSDLEQGAGPAALLLNEPEFGRKAEELARLFREYTAFLARHKLRDDEDGISVATRALEQFEAELPGGARRLTIDGFYQFSRAHRRLFAAVAARQESDVAITLPFEAGRELLFAPARRTLDVLEAEFAVKRFTLSPTGSRPPQLRHIAAALYAEVRPDPPRIREEECCVTLFDAPNLFVEVELVARELRRIHACGGLDWSDCAVIVRTQAEYGAVLASVFERYEIPLAAEVTETVTDNPLVRTLLHLLAVLREGWLRDDLLSLLKSSYTAPDRTDASRLEQAAHRGGVREGRERWIDLARRLGAATCIPTLELAARWDLSISEEPERDHAGWARLVKALESELGLEARAARGDQARAHQDRVVWKHAISTVEAMAEVARLNRRGRTSFARFHDELLAAWRGNAVSGGRERPGVRVTEPWNARERPIRVAAVMGLLEGSFPRKVRENPFLRDTEIEALRTTSGIELTEARLQSDEERLFFYLAVTAPTERLLLSYPRTTAERDALPSFFLDEIRTVLGDAPGANEPGNLSAAPHVVSRTLADVAPRPSEVVSDRDRLLAACAEMFSPAQGTPAEIAARLDTAAGLLRAALLADPHGVSEVIASRNLPSWPTLSRTDLPSRSFSVAELEAYRRCPFQHFLTYTLRMRTGRSIAAATGTLLHGALRRAFRAGTKLGVIAQPAVGPLQELLRTALQRTLEAEPIDASPHERRLLDRTLADALDRFAEREAPFQGLSRMTPSHFELAFGMGDQAARFDDEDRAELGEEEARPPLDKASCAEPLTLTSGGRSIRVCGSIDRVDLNASRTLAIAMDYKLGAPPSIEKIQRGESLQLPIYLLALERCFGVIPVAGCYDSMQSPGRSRFYRTEYVPVATLGPLPGEPTRDVRPLSRELYAELTEATEQAAVAAALGICSGRIDPRPGDHCRFCAFGDVCRTTLAHGHDGGPTPYAAVAVNSTPAPLAN